jgi:hypothetical protein
MLIAHLSLTYFLLPVSRRFPSAANLSIERPAQTRAQTVGGVLRLEPCGV